MSNYVTSLIYGRFPHGGSRFVVMLAFADAANDAGGNLWMGYDYLAAKCRMSKRQAIRVVEELKSEGWIEEHGDQARGRKIRTDRFTINLEKVTNCHPLLAAASKKKVTSGAKKSDIFARKSDTISPESKAQSQIGPEPYNHIEPGAPSGRPVDNSEPGKPPKQGTLEYSILNQRRFIQQLKKGCPYPEAIEEQEKVLAALLERQQQENAQSELFNDSKGN